ncbi:Glycogen debranching enzyme (alpha-1,6-glucosidase) [Micromonospora purpureochromogenes]|uniref:Glycogen debranching enzyme (Alpha-1,6-glucosidase) n=1 Tax=Micromonospora purpureochromogenes TaxID=47872 RepID=A0A1C4YWX8_9ACTN|nr:glycogen debranching N-terminal domain-containing protein [Micromonospora purpureochromogenes]SCF25208.1 Glycogen debranching enzyme (alpha-1,6-glucosidase) [Micromonospora purpureochromogenes]
MSDGLVRLLDGNTFVVSEETGDIDASPAIPTGFFSFDTRFLSKWILSINGERVNALTVEEVDYFESRFFVVPTVLTPLVDISVSAIRERSIGESFNERLTVINHEPGPVDLRIRIDIESDFADLFEIKDVRNKKGGHYARIEDGCLRLGYRREAFHRETLVSSTEPAHIDERGLTYDVRLEPHGEWVTDIHVQTLGVDGRDLRETLQGSPGRARGQMRQDLDRWLAEAPRLTCDSPALAMTYRRSLADLAALRFMPLTGGGHALPAAGLPWFMAIFGRDSIFTSLQALPFVPELAVTTLRLLALLQSVVLDNFREEEPGKILHELRYGETIGFEEQPHSPYFGSADSTPLYVILLDEYERWTGDAATVRMLERSARAALHWIDEYGDIMGDGYVWYRRRNEKNGLENQCWKDSWDSISFRDGRLAGLPRATCELQGYAYDAKIRGARLARQFWNDPDYADRLEREAAELKQRFNRDFWVTDGEYYALALDGDGHQVDALSSNIGHLLWSGIVEESRAARIAAHLLGPRLFSGWGVRTLAEGEGRYNPLGYHVGTVWPFDNSLIAWGLRRYGFSQEAGRIAEGIIDGAEFFEGRLPEAFGGYDRTLTRYPVLYPTACSPQAWSTGTPLLLLRTMLGMEPRGNHLVTRPAVPPGMGRIELLGIPGRWGRAGALGRARPERR